MNKMNKQNPFKTPKNYFEGFESRLRNRLSEGVADIPKDEGFSVPEGYFDSVHDAVLEKLGTDETKVIKLNPYKKFYYAAASIAAILLVAIAVNLGSVTEPSFESLAVSDIDRYFENNEIGLSSYELAEVIPVDELEVYDIIENRFAEEQMVDYLTENIEDFEALNLDYDE